MKKPTKEEIIKKWKDIGLLDGLTEMDENSKIGKLFEPILTQNVNKKTILNPDENTDKKLNISLVNCCFMCNNCRTGNLIYTGCALYSDPLQYEYKCDNCGRKVRLTEDKEKKILWL